VAFEPGYVHKGVQLRGDSVRGHNTSDREEEMKITYALSNGDGKATSWSSDYYAAKSPEGVLYWFSKSDNTQRAPVSVEDILLLGWIPYKPETEKCEACKEADTMEKFEEYNVATHLRKYHCTCKEKP